MTAPLRDIPPGGEMPATSPEPSSGPVPILRLSEMLRQIAADETRDRISLADLLSVMKTRAFGALLLVFAFPNILPSPPGLAGILGLPLLFLATQMMLGQSPWLPRFIADRAMSRAAFGSMVEKVAPRLEWAERLLKVRFRLLASSAAQRVLGAVVLALAIALSLPIPFANMAPALAICIIGLGILERDGLCIAVGLAGAVAALAYVSILGYALVKSAVFVIVNAF